MVAESDEDSVEGTEGTESNLFESDEAVFEGRCDGCDTMYCDSCSETCDGCEKTRCSQCMYETECGSEIKYCDQPCGKTDVCVDCDFCEYGPW